MFPHLGQYFPRINMAIMVSSSRGRLVFEIYMQMVAPAISNHLSRGRGLPQTGHSFSVDLIISFTLQWVHTTSQSFIFFPSGIVNCNAAAKRPGQMVIFVGQYCQKSSGINHTKQSFSHLSIDYMQLFR